MRHQAEPYGAKLSPHPGGRPVTNTLRNAMGGLLSLLMSSAAFAQAPITLYYNERPPYLVTSIDHSVSGLTATPAADAFRSAGIPFEWSKLPTNRQMAALKESKGAECAVGWFKNADREGCARFTRAIYRDRPTVALASVAFITKTAHVIRLPPSPE